MDLEQHSKLLQERITMLQKGTVTVELSEGTVVYSQGNDSCSIPLPEEG